MPLESIGNALYLIFLLSLIHQAVANNGDPKLTIQVPKLSWTESKHKLDYDYMVYDEMALTFLCSFNFYVQRTTFDVDKSVNLTWSICAMSLYEPDGAFRCVVNYTLSFKLKLSYGGQPIPTQVLFLRAKQNSNDELFKVRAIQAHHHGVDFKVDPLSPVTFHLSVIAEAHHGTAGVFSVHVDVKSATLSTQYHSKPKIIQRTEDQGEIVFRVYQNHEEKDSTEGVIVTREDDVLILICGSKRMGNPVSKVAIRLESDELPIELVLKKFKPRPSGGFIAEEIYSAALIVKREYDKLSVSCSLIQPFRTNTKTRRLDVRYAPDSILISPPTNIHYHTNVTVTCSCKSDPAPINVAWRSLGGSTDEIEVNGNYLKITEAVVFEKKYSFVCVCTAPLGNVSKEHHFIVRNSLIQVGTPSMIYVSSFTIIIAVIGFIFWKLKVKVRKKDI